MQNAYRSETPGGASMNSNVPPDVPVDVVFSITSEDASYMGQYLDEFKDGDTAARTLLIDRVMGELCRSRPKDSLFDKVDAKAVRHLPRIV